MRALAEAYPDEEFVQQLVAQIPWGHNLRILDAVSESAEREWYIRETIEHGWSRSVLVHQIRLCCKKSILVYNSISLSSAFIPGTLS